jgi:ATP-binding cassette subfamily B (MDR/TAP) protein 7
MRLYVFPLSPCSFHITNSSQTSALDTHTEQALLTHINSLVREKKRTSVFIAHRLRTIYDSDVIIVLKAGNVAESGTHQQLVDRDGLYSELWSAQETLFSDDAEKVEKKEK